MGFVLLIFNSIAILVYLIWLRLISILLNFWRVWISDPFYSAQIFASQSRLLSYADLNISILVLILFHSFTLQDKGGDPATFRETRAAFEVLRSLYQEGTVKDGTFTSYLDGVVEDDIGE